MASDIGENFGTIIKLEFHDIGWRWGKTRPMVDELFLMALVTSLVLFWIILRCPFIKIKLNQIFYRINYNHIIYLNEN